MLYRLGTLSHVIRSLAASNLRQEPGAPNGGALDADTILVEAFTSEQSSADPAPVFTRSRYQLVRVSGTTPLLHRPESWAAGDLSRAAFGDV